MAKLSSSKEKEYLGKKIWRRYEKPEGFGDG
jgi:hypothetical protein